MDKIKVLIVEDDPINQFIMLKHVSQLFDCQLAGSGTEAIGVLKEEVFDVVLMDINLGNDHLNGEDLMRLIRSDIRHMNTAVVAVTSYAMAGDKEYFLNSGFDLYHPKPILRDEIIQTVYKAFGESDRCVKMTA